MNFQIIPRFQIHLTLLILVSCYNICSLFIEESLRIYPPGFWSTKCCTLQHEVKNKNGEIFAIEEGETVLIPIYALHHDPQFYPQPEQFKPERFLQQPGGVKYFKDRGVFLGFGDGPRTCLGINLFKKIFNKHFFNCTMLNFLQACVSL